MPGQTIARARLPWSAARIAAVAFSFLRACRRAENKMTKRRSSPHSRTRTASDGFSFMRRVAWRILLKRLIHPDRRPRGSPLMTRPLLATLAALAALALLTPASAQQAQGKKYALLVGVKEYKGANFGEL